MLHFGCILFPRLFSTTPPNFIRIRNLRAELECRTVLECLYAIILHTSIAHLVVIALTYFYLLQPLVFLLQLIIDFVSFLCIFAIPAASMYLAFDI